MFKLGGKVQIGGKPADDLGPTYFQPTLITDISPASLCLRDETFGPLLPLIKFEFEEDAVRLANEMEVGLADYLLTGNGSKAWRMAEGLQVGMVQHVRCLFAERC